MRLLTVALSSRAGALSLCAEAFPAPTIRAVSFLLSLLALQLTLLVVVPGARFSGPRAPSGHVPRYTDNGFACFFATLLALAVACARLGLPPTLIYDELLPILSRCVGRLEHSTLRAAFRASHCVPRHVPPRFLVR